MRTRVYTCAGALTPLSPELYLRALSAGWSSICWRIPARGSGVVSCSGEACTAAGPALCGASSAEQKAFRPTAPRQPRRGPRSPSPGP